MDGVGVVEAGDEQPAIERTDQLLAGGLAGAHRHVQRERAIGVRCRQAVACRRSAGPARCLGVPHDVATDAPLNEHDALLGDPS